MWYAIKCIGDGKIKSIFLWAVMWQKLLIGASVPSRFVTKRHADSIMVCTPHFHCLDNKPAEPWAQLFLAHGAGAGWDHPWLNTMVQHLVEQGVWVRRLEFPYAQQMRKTGRRRPPQPVAQLQHYFAELLYLQREENLPCFVGGKSMG